MIQEWSFQRVANTLKGRKSMTYEKAQERYDRMEHPDYWDDDEAEFEAELERKIDHADFRRKEKKEDALIKSLGHDEQMEYFKRGGR
jgi:hypothetical protein